MGNGWSGQWALEVYHSISTLSRVNFVLLKQEKNSSSLEPSKMWRRSVVGRAPCSRGWGADSCEWCVRMCFHMAGRSGNSGPQPEESYTRVPVSGSAHGALWRQCGSRFRVTSPRKKKTESLSVSFMHRVYTHSTSAWKVCATVHCFL
jgi:hypothetical protein